MPKFTLTPAYLTTNTVRFDEVVAPKPSNSWLDVDKTPTGVLGSMYFKKEQLDELGWAPTSVGDEYAVPGQNGRVFHRRDVTGPSFEVSLTLKA